MRLAEQRPHHRLVAELGTHPCERASRRIPVAAGPLDEQPLLHGRDRDGAAGDPHFGDPRPERQRVEAQPHQVHQLDDVRRRGGGTEPLGVRIGAVEPQAQRQLGQRFVTHAHGRQQPIQETLDVEEETNGVALGIVEVTPRDERIGIALRLQRRPQVAGGETMQASRLRAEAAADPLRGQSQERLHRPHTELVQTVPEHRIDAQPTQPHPTRLHPFGSRVADHRHRLAGREGPGDGTGTEPREPDRDRRPKAVRRGAKRRSPVPTG